MKQSSRIGTGDEDMIGMGTSGTWGGGGGGECLTWHAEFLKLGE